jgi:hypothetical protein
MPTLEGVVFLPLALYFFFKRPHLLFPLLILSAVFQASSIISSGPVGVQPYYCIAALFILRTLIIGQRRIGPRPPNSFQYLWLAFAALAVASAFVLPIVFEGIPVFDPRQTTIDNALNPSALKLQSTNFVQSIFLTVNVLVVIAAARQGAWIGAAQKMFRRAAYVVVAAIFLQMACYWTGVPFPDQLLNNNPGYGLVPITEVNLRPAGSFTEPSMAGAVLAAIIAAFLWSYFAGKMNILRAAIAICACALVASSSSILAIAFVLVLLVMANPIFRFPWFIRLSAVRRMSAFIVCGAFMALMLVVPSVRTMLVSQTLEKGSSDSALVRFGADLFAIGLTIQTHGLGVGLGSNRPSGLAASLLSQVGLAGFVLFFSAAAATLWKLPKQDRWISMAALALLLAMTFGIPDLSFPFLWVLFALAAQSRGAAALEAEPARASVAASEASGHAIEASGPARAAV